MASQHTELDGFQFEVERRGSTTRINLVVSSVRGIRGKRKLLGEAYMRDSFTPVLNFQVRYATTVEDLRDRFIRQLVKQGYLPTKFRRQVTGSFEDWVDVDHSRFDMSTLEAGRAPASTTEA